MSSDKKGIRIKEDDESIHISAENNFAEKTAYSKEIFDLLNKKENKRLRITLTPKTKFFPDTLFKIRKAIMGNKWEDASIRIHTRQIFKQTINFSGSKLVKTPAYTSTLNNDELRIWTSQERCVFPNDDYAKEMAFLIGLDKPRFLDVFFNKAHREKPEEFHKRANALQRFFIPYIRDIYSIENVSFYDRSEENKLSSFVRYLDCKQLIKEDTLYVMPVVKAKHSDFEIPDDENEKTKE